MSPFRDSSPDRVPPELVYRELEAILASKSFANSARLSRFLRYVVEQTLEGSADRLKEYQLGVDVFGRAASYDTRTDPVVRVEARQLRFKLADYYASTGREDEIIIGLPKGGYSASFNLREAAAAPVLPIHEVEAGARAPTPPRSRSKAVWIGWVAGVAAIGLAIALAPRYFEPRNTTPHQPTAEARDLYLKGRYYWNKRTPDDLNQSVDLFTQAIVKDPGYAAAYVGLADAYNLLSEFSAMPYQDAFTRALAAAKKAVELDGRSAEAHSALAFASYYGAWDATSAEREFKRAMELNPGYGQAHHWYATFLVTEGRFPEALAEIEKARELEPASMSVVADKGLILFHAGQTEAAIALLQQMESSEPTFLSPHEYLSTIYLHQGEYAKYVSELRKAALLSRNAESLALADAAEKGYRTGGVTSMLREMLTTEETFSNPGHQRYYALARTCAMLGEKARAIQYLNAALKEREPSVLNARVDLLLEKLHGEPAYSDLLKQIRAAER